jgi:hypothetical protein
MGLIETIGAVIVAIVAALFLGRRQGRLAERAKVDKAYRETREKMDEVVVGDDPDAARRWLRERGQ